MSTLKGSKISSKLAFVRDEFDEDMLERVLASMSPADRTELDTLFDLRWYSFDLYDRLLATICRVVAHSDEAIYARIGHHSAQYQFDHLYAAYRRENLEVMAGKLVTMHQHRNNPAVIEVSFAPDGWVLIVEEPKSTAIACLVAAGFYQRIAELCGARDVTVTEPQCTSRGHPACRFEVRWTPLPK